MEMNSTNSAKRSGQISNHNYAKSLLIAGSSNPVLNMYALQSFHPTVQRNHETIKIVTHHKCMYISDHSCI